MNVIILSPSETKDDAMLNSLSIAARTIFSSSYIMTLKKVLDGEEAEKEKTWADVGSEIIEKLKDYIVFDDERIYDVVASYIVMTYFYDVFTAAKILLAFSLNTDSSIPRVGPKASTTL